MKIIAIFCVLALLLTVCACGRPAEEPATEPPAATPTEAVTEAAAMNYDFRLEELPDIGDYSHTEPTYYYDAPLSEFRTSDAYGTIVPYMLKAEDLYVDVIRRCGFMTADGAIITAPVYDDIELQSAGDESFYIARCKTLNLSPPRFDSGDDVPGTDTEQEARYEEYRAAVNDAWRNTEYQCISTDGSRCLSSLGAAIRLFTDQQSGTSVIECQCLDGLEHPVADDMLAFRLYDTQFRLLADFSDLAVTYRQGLEIVGADETGFALVGILSDSPDEYKADVIYTEGDRITKTTTFDFYVEKAFCGWIVSNKSVYDPDGRKLLSVENDFDAMLADPCFEAVWYTDLASHRLIRLDQNGQQTEYDGVEGEQLRLYPGEADGKRFIVLEESNANWNDPCSSYTVFDGSLRPVYRLPYQKGTEIRVHTKAGTWDAQWFMIGRDGKTELRGLAGELLAELPYHVKDYYGYDDGAAILQADDGHVVLFSPADRSVKETNITAAEEINFWQSFYGGSVLVLGEYDTYGNDGRQRLYNAATGQLILTGVDNFNCVWINGNLYCAVAVGDECRVYDGDLRLLLRIYDDINV